MEVDERGHKDMDGEKRRGKRQLNKKINCRFIRINPDEENFDLDIHLSAIQVCIIESTKSKLKKLNKFVITIKHANLLFRL